VAPDRAGRRNPAAVAHPLLKKTASAGAAGFVSLKTTEAARPRDGFSRNIEDKAAIGLSLLKELSPGGGNSRIVTRTFTEDYAQTEC
jgi:hypothetical protein